jgi:hypothetical protein
MKNHIIRKYFNEQDLLVRLPRAPSYNHEDRQIKKPFKFELKLFKKLVFSLCVGLSWLGRGGFIPKRNVDYLRLQSNVYLVKTVNYSWYITKS